MKQYLVAASFLFAVAAHAQKSTPKKTTTKTTTKTAVVQNPLKNKVDSVSYAIGSMVANFYKQQGIESLNPAMISKAVTDIYNSKKVLLNEQQCQTVVMRAMNPDLDKNLAEGNAFLAANKKKPGVITTASGLQYEIVTLGTGIKPTIADTVIAHYAGTLLNGQEFDNSYRRGQPLTIGVGQVIRGWTEGLQLMPVGSKFKFYIPQEIGYGMNDQGAIPGGSLLVFEVELLGIKGK